MIKNENINNLVKKFNENKLSHVFLIETNDKSAVLTDLLEVIKVINCPENEYDLECKKCNLCHLIDTNTLPSLKIIYPDGQAIKKAQMEELKNEFVGIPYLSKNNTYIINDAEKLNASSANTMLKFIEEPESNILGFLITNNKENVIETIKSRCEIVKANYNTNGNSIVNEKLSELVEEYLYKLEVEKSISIVYNKIVLDEKLEKEDLIKFFQIILKIYIDLLNENSISNKLEELSKLSKQEIIKRIELVNIVIERLNYNVNANLILDYFVLSLED